MNIPVIGAGTMAAGLAQRPAKAGYAVVPGSRDRRPAIGAAAMRRRKS